MPASLDLVVCSLEDWDAIWRRNQFFVREILDARPEARILFVGPPQDLVHDARRRSWKRTASSPREIDEFPGLWVMKPWKVLPRAVGGAADRHLANQVRRAARHLGFDRPFLWINDAAFVTLAESVDWPCLYDMTDDWLVADGIALRERHRREDRERRLMARAEEVVACSELLRANRQDARPRKIHLVPNAVDADRFAVPGPRPGDLPSGPVALYSGTLHRDRLDVELVDDVVAALPDVNFTFIGPIALPLEDEQRLSARPNVHLLGPRPYKAMPPYLLHAEVLIAPHVVTPFTDSLDPLKVYEYLAARRPIVSTAVAGFRDLADGLCDCVGREAFAAGIEAALERSTAVPARANLPTWSARTADFLAVLHGTRSIADRRPLRVVFLDHCAQLSGAEIALARLLPALVGVEPIVVLAEHGPLEARLAESGVASEVMAMPEVARGLRRREARPGSLPFRAIWETIGYTLRLRRRLLQLRPDVVHTNSLKAAVFGVAAARLARIPVVCHLRDRIADDYLPSAAVPLLRAAFRWAPTALVANSRSTLSTVVESADGRAARQLRAVIHDPAPAPTPRAARRQAPFHVAMVGRLAPWKGQDLFLRAFTLAFPTGEARAVIVGSAMFGEDDYERELRDLVGRLGLEERVGFTGFVEDVATELATVHVLVHASVIPEPFGQVIIEAMSAGVPVIAAAAGGPLEIIDDGRTGLLVTPGDVDGLAQALRRLHDAPDFANDLAAAALESMHRFEPARIASQVEDLYGAVLGRTVRR